MFDREAFEAVTAGDAEIGRELWDLYRSDSAKLIEDLERHVASSEDDGVRRVAHTLKSSSGSLGATRASEIAAQIEAAGLEAANAQLSELKNAIQGAIDQIENLIEQG